MEKFLIKSHERRMNVSFLFILIVLTSLNIHAQNKISATLAYPLPVGDNSASSYTGILDVGLQARIFDISPVKMGLSTNANYLRNSTELGSITFKESAFLFQPRVFVELNLEAISKFRPFLGLGYTFTSFKTKSDESNSNLDVTNNSGGLNINLGTAYYFTDNFFAHLQYDNIRLSQDSFEDNGFNSKISLLKFGVGLGF